MIKFSNLKINQPVRIHWEIIKKRLGGLHQSYIVLALNRASGNFSIICKNPYTLTLAKKLGVNGENSSKNKTYGMINYTSESDIDKNILNRYRLCINEQNKCLPHIYWLLKLKRTFFKKHGLY